jgi:SAM-dependent methyltransferase
VFSFEHLDALRSAEIDRVVPLFPPGVRVLELGAGTGAQALELRRRGFDVTAIELPSSSYSAHRVSPVVDYDGATIPVSDSSIDLVYSSNVLEHVPDLSRIHAEIRRVLTPDGRCIHILPTHGWRFWTTLTGYPDAFVHLFSALPQLMPHGLPRSSELQRMTEAWHRTARAVGGRWLPRRHGERGNAISEMWLFHPSWWRRNFQSNGFTVVRDEPMGLFYTGNMLLGARLPLSVRARLAALLGSACHVFVLEAAAGQFDGSTGHRSRA